MKTLVFDRITLRCVLARIAIGLVLVLASAFGILGQIVMLYTFWGAGLVFLIALLVLSLVQYPDNALEQAKQERIVQKYMRAHPKRA